LQVFVNVADQDMALTLGKK